MKTASLKKRSIASAYARMGPDLRLFAADLVCRNFEETTYQRLADAGFRPGAYIDVGAFHGNWSLMANRIMGQRPTLMVEGQPALVPALTQLAAGKDGWQATQAVLSATEGEELEFFTMGTGSSIFAEASNAARESETVLTRTLDGVAAAFVAPLKDIFLKIDVQGAELPILRGASAVLEKAALVQLEVALLPYNRGAPLMPEVVAWMADHGWFPTEISGFSRPAGPLVQIDLLFARAGSPLRPDYFEF